MATVRSCSFAQSSKTVVTLVHIGSFRFIHVAQNTWLAIIFFCTCIIAVASFTAFADGHLSIIDLFGLLTLSWWCFAWIDSKPENQKRHGISTMKYYGLSSDIPQHETYRHKTERRMLQLEKHHLITQEYTLAIPYLCQIYHLLNIKHLESVHGFSLNSLQIAEVGRFRKTKSGGTIKFQTVLVSPSSLLKMFRRPVVEVDLILHTPYTIDLNVPVHNGKKIFVIFNVLPLGGSEHKLFIDIYSDLIVPKLMLQALLHCASMVTLLEDLPYLRQLSKTNLPQAINVGRASHETMQLFNRFMELYGSCLQQPPALGAVELCPLPSC